VHGRPEATTPQKASVTKPQCSVVPIIFPALHSKRGNPDGTVHVNGYIKGQRVEVFENCRMQTQPSELPSRDLFSTTRQEAMDAVHQEEQRLIMQHLDCIMCCADAGHITDEAQMQHIPHASFWQPSHGTP